MILTAATATKSKTHDSGTSVIGDRTAASVRTALARTSAYVSLRKYSCRNKQANFKTPLEVDVHFLIYDKSPGSFECEDTWERQKLRNKMNAHMNDPETEK